MWLIATFLIPIFQSVLANELYKEEKFHWNVLLKSKVFWILLALWIIGNIVAKIMESNNSNDNQAVKKKNKLSIKGDGNTVGLYFAQTFIFDDLQSAARSLLDSPSTDFTSSTLTGAVIFPFANAIRLIFKT